MRPFIACVVDYLCVPEGQACVYTCEDACECGACKCVKLMYSCRRYYSATFIQRRSYDIGGEGSKVDPGEGRAANPVSKWARTFCKPCRVGWTETDARANRPGPTKTSCGEVKWQPVYFSQLFTGDQRGGRALRWTLFYIWKSAVFFFLWHCCSISGQNHIVGGLTTFSNGAIALTLRYIREQVYGFLTLEKSDFIAIIL